MNCWLWTCRNSGSIRRTLAILLAALPWVAPLYAHEGPPFPIITDYPVGSMMVSVWTDPDIGTGTFYVVLEPASEGDTVPDDISVRIGVTPKSGRLKEAVYEARPQPVRYGARYLAEVQFDQGEWWNVRVTVDSPSGTGLLTAEVEATPDGQIGPISLLVYALPFLAIGLLWLKAALRRRRGVNDKSVEGLPEKPTAG